MSAKRPARKPATGATKGRACAATEKPADKAPAKPTAAKGGPREGDAAPKLTDAHRLLVIRRIAEDATPQTIVDELQARCAIEVSRQAIEYYDPGKNLALAERWRTEYARHRQAYLRDLSVIPLSYKAMRVRELAGLYTTAKEMKNLPLAAELLERIAKEVGDAYSNRRIFTPEDPAEALARELGMTVEEVRALVATLDGPVLGGDGARDGA